MISKIRTLIISILILTFGMITSSGAASKPNPARMQQHVDKVKITHPKKYQEIMEQTGGVIEDCIACHKDLKTKKGRAGYLDPRDQR